MSTDTQSQKINDLEEKEARIFQALLETGIQQSELVAVTVLALLENASAHPDVKALPIARLASIDQEVKSRLKANIDRGIHLNLAITGLAKANL